MSVPRFLADQDLRRPIVRATIALDSDIEFLLARDLGLDAAPDGEVLARACAEGLLLVSHDVNTMKAEAERRMHAGEPLAGLFLIPQTRGDADVARSIHLIWSASDAEEWRDRIVFLPF